MNKIISIILCLSLILGASITVSGQDSSEQTVDETLSVAKKALRDLNMWKDFNEESPYLTRAEVATNVCIWYGIYDNPGKIIESYMYADVPVSHWANYWVAMASYPRDALNRYVFGGDGGGIFRPDDYMTYQEFVKVLTTVLGWSVYSTMELDGYPYGDWGISEMLGINPFDKSKMQELITENDAITMVYKALNVIRLEDTFSSGICFRYLDDTLITLRMSFDEKRSQIRGYAKKADDDTIVIDGITYYGKVNDDNFTEGYVLCFYDDADKQQPEYRKIVCCYPISSLDFDSPQSINESLLDWEYILKGEIYG